MWVVIENESQGGTRALSSPEALSSFEARGYTALGGCSDPAREPLLTDAEQAKHDAAEAARIADLLKSDAAPAVVAP